MRIEPAETQQRGEIGWGYGTFHATLTPHGGGAPVEMKGKYLNIVQPREDGTLEILRHCWNSDQPMPGPS
jgi:ketosteroid isomerase-like protein